MSRYGEVADDRVYELLLSLVQTLDYARTGPDDLAVTSPSVLYDASKAAQVLKLKLPRLFLFVSPFLEIMCRTLHFPLR